MMVPTNVFYDLLKIDGAIVAGDSNYSKIKWKQEGSYAIPIAYEGVAEKNFIKSLNDSFLTQFIYFSTFQTSEMNLTDTLDLIISDNQSRIFDINNGPVLGNIKKAHNFLTWKVKYKDEVVTAPTNSIKFKY